MSPPMQGEFGEILTHLQQPKIKPRVIVVRKNGTQVVGVVADLEDRGVGCDVGLTHDVPKYGDGVHGAEKRTIVIAGQRYLLDSFPKLDCFGFSQVDNDARRASVAEVLDGSQQINLLGSTSPYVRGIRDEQRSMVRK